MKDIKDKSPNKETVKMLTGLLKLAETGELRTVIIVEGFDDDRWDHCWSIDYRSSRRRMIGEISMTQFDMLTNQSLDDGDSILSAALQ